MKSRARNEILAIVALLIVYACLLLPALKYERREVRDGIRRDEIAAFKRQLEQHFNVHNTYPLEFNASPHEYVATREEEDGAKSFFLRAKLENAAENEEGYDAEAGRNYNYRVINKDGETYYEVCGGTPSCPIAESPHT